MNNLADLGLSIQTFLFQGANIRIKGTTEEPLFNCLDVVKIFGCKEANYNKFYKQFKGDYTLITAVTNSQGSESVNTGPINYHSEVQHYFTETGLYECIFASDSAIAKIFRREIIYLLKNIRLGVLYVHIYYIELLKQYISENSAMLQKYQSYLQKASQEISIYYLKAENGRTYIGSTNNPERRFYQHRKNSCNKEVREAMSQGRVDMKVIQRVRVLSRDDIKYAERNAILAVPAEQRMNIYVPSVNIGRVTIDQYEEVKDDMQSEIFSSITEEQSECITLPVLDYAKHPKYFSLFTSKVDYLKQFIKERKQYPNKRNEQDYTEKMLGYFVDTLRQQINNPKAKLPMPPERRQYLYQYIPHFIADEKEHAWRQNVLALANFINTNHKYPVGRKGEPGSTEAVLAKFLAHLRESYKGSKSASHSLTEERILFIYQYIPNFEWNEDNYLDLKTALAQLKQFLIQNRRLPRNCQNADKTVPESELLIGYRLHNIRMSLKTYPQAKIDYFASNYPVLYNIITNKDISPALIDQL